MSNYIAINQANVLMVHLFARFYLSPKYLNKPITVEGGSVTHNCVSNRTNVPADATTFAYLVEHPELGFSFRFRAVWREGKLYHPAVHTVIEKEWDEGAGSPAAVSAAINQWLQAVTG